jgi:hypothetical protein
MHSLESEYRQMQRGSAIDDAAAARAIALERREIFSVFAELRLVLYAAVAAVTGGIAILVKDNIKQIGPLTLMAGLALVAALCYATAIRTLMRRKARSIGGDYLLLLGALIVSADLGYIEHTFHWLGTHWSWYLLLLAVLHALTAYVFESRLVLSVSLTTLCGWFGVEWGPANWFQGDMALRNTGLDALGCASTLVIWREIHRRQRGSAPLGDVLEHFAANLAFWGTVILCFDPQARAAGIAVLTVLSVACIRKGLKESQEAFVVYGVAYTALGLCVVEEQIDRGLIAQLSQLVTVTAAVIVLWLLHQRAKAL